MIEHIETYENASKYLWDKTKTIPRKDKYKDQPE